MKKEGKLRLICFIASLLILAHFCYYAFFRQNTLLPILIMAGVWAPNLILNAFLEPKKIRNPDFSKIFNFAGILIAVCTLILYFSYFLGVWQGEWVAYFILFFTLAYIAFLAWYKGRLWS